MNKSDLYLIRDWAVSENSRIKPKSLLRETKEKLNEDDIVVLAWVRAVQVYLKNCPNPDLEVVDSDIQASVWG